MDKELSALIERRGLYNAARSLLLRQQQTTQPITVLGFPITKYISIQPSRVTGHKEVLEAANRLWDEGFLSLVYYPPEDNLSPHLLVVWDERISTYNIPRMPCFDCMLEMHERSKCRGCDTLNVWASVLTIPGSLLPGAMEEQVASASVSDLVVKSDSEIYACIPSASQMRLTSEAFKDENLDSFEESLYLRIMKRLERWPMMHHSTISDFQARPFSTYITVPLTPRESDDSATLRGVIVKMEQKGYCCGPLVSTLNREVLFVTWDEDLSYYFPNKSPCSCDCDDVHGSIEDCYCTEYNTWFAKWKYLVQNIRVPEQ